MYNNFLNWFYSKGFYVPREHFVIFLSFIFIAILIQVNTALIFLYYIWTFFAIHVIPRLDFKVRWLLCILLIFPTSAYDIQGLQPNEIVFLSLFLSYLLYWFFVFSPTQRNINLINTFDYIYLLFCIWCNLSGFFMGIITNSKFDSQITELIWFQMFWLYYPIKYYVKSLYFFNSLILLILASWGIYIGISKIYEFQYAVNTAEALWQIAGIRIASVETILAVGTIIGFCFCIYYRGTQFLFGLLTFLISFIGLLITRSRGFWAGAFFGILIFGMLCMPYLKIRLVKNSLLLTALLLIFINLLAGQYFLLFYKSTLERIQSVQTASKYDISYLSRMPEYEAVEHKVYDNPVLGYGFGQQYTILYDIILKTSLTKHYTHNIYLHLLYKHGLIGLCLFLAAFLYATFRNIYCLFYIKKDLHKRFILTISISILLHSFPSWQTNNPFLLRDSILIMIIAFASCSNVFVSAND